MTLFLRYAAKSDVGMVRKANEDSGFAGRSLLAVADGMGGHAAGELASSTAIATLAELDSEDLPTESLLTALDDAIVTSAERIAQFIDADPTRAGMGTTVTAILWRAGRIAVIHVGDSRAYLLRGGVLTQITHDHTYVQSLIDAGRITPDQARRHPKRNLLLRAIDGNQVPEGETSMREAQAGDRYLLCSDGLCGVVEDDVIARALADFSDPTAAVTALVDLALEAGAPDNVTAVVADVVTIDDSTLDLEAELMTPVVVGAAGEQRNRAALPGLQFPDDVMGDATGPIGPAVAGGLAVRVGDRSAAEAASRPNGDVTGVMPGVGAATGTIGEALQSGELVVGEPAGVGTEPGASQADVGDAPSEPSFVRRHAIALAMVAGVVAALIVGLLGFLWWLSAQWFVGQTSGYITISQGVPQEFVGIPLHRVAQTTALQVEQLPLYDQGQVAQTIDAGTQEEAERIVAQLAAKIASCQSVSPPLGCPSPIPGTGQTPTPSASASPAVPIAWEVVG
jgi:serine/threonine protein phosphatase PrpC